MMLRQQNGLPKTPLLSRTPYRSRDALSTMDPVEVFCRLRPSFSLDGQLEKCVFAFNERTIQLVPPARPGVDIIKGSQCTFTRVFDETASQSELFERIGFDFVNDLIQGKNGLLFTYGITGSGKTYTMTGNPKELGILPRCLDTLFNSIRDYQAAKYVFKPDSRTNTFDIQSECKAALEVQREGLRTQASQTPKVYIPPTPTTDNAEWEFLPRVIETSRVRHVNEDNAYAVFVSYVQIYNNFIYDLLDTQAQANKLPPSKILREDIERNMYVSGITEVEVKTTEEAFDVFIKGQRLRRTAHTLLNTESSRSHSVFNIRLVQAPLDETGREVLQDRRKIYVSQLSLVDLAGSERSKRTGNIGERIRETGNINESLMTLRQCIEQLRENQKTGSSKLVPYRNSRLTHLFKNYFDGEGKVRMIVCVNPSVADCEENRHVMEFAEITQEVEVPRANGAAQHGLCADEDGISLTPGRRRAAALYDRVREQMEKELASVANALPKTPSFSLFFDPMPVINLNGLTPDDDSWIHRLRTHFETHFKRRHEMVNELTHKQTAFEGALRKFVIDHEALKERYQEESRAFAECEKDNERLRVELCTAQRQIATLDAKLGRYERDAKFMQNQGEAFKKRERDMAAQVRQKDEKLRAVKEIFERAGPMATPNFGGHDTVVASAGAVLKTSLYPPLPSVMSSTPLRAGPRGRAPSPPPKPSANLSYAQRAIRTTGRQNGADTRTRRRSKSIDATVYDTREASRMKKLADPGSAIKEDRKRKSSDTSGEDQSETSVNGKKTRF